MNDLIERIEAASGPDRGTDLAIAEFAFDQRIPPPCYGGRPTNYDPRMWLARHGWSPTASIDAALTLVPEGFEWSLEYQAGHHVSSDVECMIAIAKLGDPCRDWESTSYTPALALSAAALKARASLKETNNAD